MTMKYKLVDEWQKFYKTSYRSPSRQAMNGRTRFTRMIWD
jgi:hypothetical protein